MTIARIEKADRVAYTDGTRVLKLPSLTACRERLIKLLEEAGGDINQAACKVFWEERIKDMGKSDELDSEWGRGVFDRLDKIWCELTTAPEPESDVFGSFGI